MIKLDYNKLCNSNILEWGEINNDFNKVLEKIVLNNTSLTKYKNEDLVKNRFLYHSDGITKLDTARITQDALLKFYKMTLLNPELRKEYLECFLNYQNISIETVDIDFEIDDYTSAAYDYLKNQDQEILELLFFNPNETITVYAKKINKKSVYDYDASNFFVNDIDGKFANHILGILRRKTSAEKIAQYLQLYKIGFSHFTRISLIHLQQKTYNKILNSFRSLIFLILIESGLEIKRHKMTGEDLTNYELIKMILGESKKVDPDINAKRIFYLLPPTLKANYRSSNALSMKINEFFLSKVKFKRIEVDGDTKKVRVNVPVRFRTFEDLLNLWKNGNHSIEIVEDIRNLLVEKVKDYLGINELPQSVLDILNNVGVVCGTQDKTEDNQVSLKVPNHENEFPFRTYDNKKT